MASSKRGNIVKKDCVKIGYVFLDISYILFWKYFGVMSYYTRFKDGDVKEEDFLKTFTNSLNKFFNTMKKIFPTDEYIWVIAKDTPRKNIWRLNLQESYKSTRDNDANNKNRCYLSSCFSKFWSDDTYFKTIQHEYNIILMTVDTLEADDVVGLFVKQVKQSNPNTPCYIIASDHDYVQLKKYTNTYIYDMRTGVKSKLPFDRDISYKYSSNVIKNFVLYKSLVGDKSDNIPSVHIRLKKGDTRAKQMTAASVTKLINSNRGDVSHIMDMLDYDENKRAKNQYEKNKKLIDFEEIPEDLQANFMEAYNNIRIKYKLI